MRIWHHAGNIAALLAAVLAAASPVAAATRVGLCAAGLAVLALAPDPGRRQHSRLRMGLGWALAVVVLAVGSTHWLPAISRNWTHTPAAVAFSLVILAVSLIIKPWLPRIAVTGDMLAGFVGYAVILDFLLGAPAARHPKPGADVFHWSIGLAIFLVAGAWMSVWPHNRPVAFFVESGSAGSVLRRLLPITLVYPLLLVLLGALRSHAYVKAAVVAQAVLVYGTIVFGIALFWVISHVLDRRDAQRRTAEHELRSSEERYRQLFERDPSPAWVFDATTLRILAVNDSAVARYGYSRDELLRMTVPDLWPAPADTPVAGHVAMIRNANGAIHHHRAKDGRRIEVEVYTHAVDWQGGHDGRGKPLQARLAFMHDVTDRLRAEHQLRESESRVRTLLESTSEGIYAVNQQGECIWCNPAAVNILGAGHANAILGHKIHDLIHHTRPDGSPYSDRDCVMMLATMRGESLNVEEELVWRLDGSNFPADFRSSPLWQDGKIVGAVVSFTDVTERRQLRMQFQQAQKMEAVGRLAAGVAHDFNNLLTVINGYTDLLMAQAAPPQTRSKVVSIRQAGERAAGLTKQLLAFSRQQVLEPKVLDLNTVLQEMDPLLRRVIGEDLILTTAVDPGIGRVRADPGQVSQVLMNLVVNARDAMPNGGRITIETANVTLDENYVARHPEVTPGEYVAIVVTDTGTGMDEATQQHLFEPFFTTKPAGKGTGLGLATVFGIVKQSGGSIGVYSEIGRGTAMKVYLPRLVSAAEAEAVAAAPAAAPVHGRETILLVEDEEIVRGLVSEILTSAGYHVLAAERPQQAIELARTEAGSIELLISDVVMPEMDGRKLMRAVLELRPKIAVLFVSGYPDRAIAEHGELDPGLAFLQKPFTPESLCRKTRETLDAGPAAKRLAATG